MKRFFALIGISPSAHGEQFKKEYILALIQKLPGLSWGAPLSFDQVLPNA